MHPKQLFEKIRLIFSLPATSPFGLVVIGMIGVLIYFAPQVNPNDWEINTSQLFNGLSIYVDGEFLYPPWSLLLLWPYRLIQSYGARLFALLVAAWLASSRGWSLGRLLSIVFNALFIYAIMFSNLDMLVLTFPVLLWEQSRNWSGSWFFWGVSISLMLLKPQGMIFLLPYLIYQRRQQKQKLLYAVLVTLLITVPISLVGSPPLFLQWFNNIFSPTSANQHHFGTNNISLVSRVGWLWGPLIVAAVFYGVYALMKLKDRSWTQNHSYASLLLASMLVSPYTSSQSAIAGLVFVPSWWATILQYMVLALVIGTKLSENLSLSPLWILLFGFISMWFYQVKPSGQKSPNA
jgi:hypothetical protein